MCWRYDLESNLPQLLKDQTVPSGQESMKINLLKLCGAMAAFATNVILQERSKTEGDPVLLRGDNVAAVSWVDRCGRSRDKLN